MEQVITSKQNERVKQLVALRDRRDRDRAGVFLVEGYREVRRALQKDIKISELYFCPDWFLGENEQALIDQAQKAGAELFELSKDVFAKASYRDRPDGLLAIADQWHTDLDDLKLSDKPLILVVESIEKPGNLGTMLRTADGAGVDAVIVCDPVTDIFNPNIVRSSTGVLFSVPLVVSDSKTVHTWLRAKNIKIVATTPDTDKVYTSADLTQSVAIVMGSEQYGLTDFWLKDCDEPVRIPMKGQADSLNVAISAALLVYEALRQRSS